MRRRRRCARAAVVAAGVLVGEGLGFRLEVEGSRAAAGAEEGMGEWCGGARASDMWLLLLGWRSVGTEKTEGRRVAAVSSRNSGLKTGMGNAAGARRTSRTRASLARPVVVPSSFSKDKLCLA